MPAEGLVVVVISAGGSDRMGVEEIVCYQCEGCKGFKEMKPPKRRVADDQTDIEFSAEETCRDRRRATLGQCSC